MKCIKDEPLDVDLSAIEGIDARGEGVPHVAKHLNRNSAEAIAEAREKLERWVLDENRPITASYALKRCQLDAGHMQSVLSDFAEQNATKVQVCHWLTGKRLPDNDADENDGVECTAVRVCHQEELERVEREVYASIITRRIYSVQPNEVKDMQTIYNVDHLDPMPRGKAVLEGKTTMFYTRAWKNYRRYKSTEADYTERMQRKQEQRTFDVLKRNEPLGKKERGPKMILTMEEHMKQQSTEEEKVAAETTTATSATGVVAAATTTATSATGVVATASALGTKRQLPHVKAGKGDAVKRKKMTNEPRSGPTMTSFFKRLGDGGN